MIAAHESMKAAGTVVETLAQRLVVKGCAKAGESARDLAVRAELDPPASQKPIDDLRDWLSETNPVESDKEIDGRFPVQRMGPRRDWLESTISGDTKIGSMPVPARVVKACQVGWDVGRAVASTNRGWRLVEVWNDSP
ncbi:MAG: hypothetical protein AB7I30_06970 [Isosphaeraceae bacterium]